LRAWDPGETKHTFVKGFVRATGLYKTLHAYRAKGKVVVFDDADSIFFDEVSLNLLKGACDSTDRRRLSWLAETTMIDEATGNTIDTQFEFEGSVIFCTNIDFDAMIEKGHKLAPHLNAMVSRAHYVDLAMKNRNDYLVRINMVMREGVMLKELTTTEKSDVMKFIVEHYSPQVSKFVLRELSLRMALKLGMLRKSLGTEWERTARITCCKTTV
ncbi:MAG: hypothetical protein ACHQU0_03730, partial [Candidatus Paceibacteria bacterium]